MNKSGGKTVENWDDDETTITIPALEKKLLPEHVRISEDLWKDIYLLLLEAPNQMLTPIDLSLQYSKKYKKSLGGKDFLIKCRVRNLVNLICAFPDVEPYRSNGTMYYHLRDRNSAVPRLPYREKLQRMENKSKKHGSDESSSEDETLVYYDDDDDEENLLPPQMPELLPYDGRLPEDLRFRIYKLLNRKKYQNGVSLKEFKEDYAKQYGRSLNNLRDCCMTEEQLIYSLRDILENTKDDLQNIWIKPRTLDEIKKIHAERPSEIINVVVPVKEKRLPPYYKKQPVSVNDPKSLSSKGFIRVDAKTALMEARQNFNSGESSKKSPEIQQIQSSSSSSATSSSSFVNKTAVSHIIGSNMRTNCARENERLEAAQKNLNNLNLNVMTNAANSYPQPTQQESPPYEFNDLELLAESLATFRDWTPVRDLEQLFSSKYGRILKLPANMRLIDALECRPELFALIGVHSVKARRFITGAPVEYGKVTNPETVVDFGLEPGIVFSGSLDTLQLEVGEDLEVYVSYVNDYGEICLQMVHMEPSFKDLEYDMTQFYSETEPDGRFEMSLDFIKVGFPVALFVKPNWHRGVIANINRDPSGRDICEVQDVDFGKNYWVDRNKIRFLRQDFVENRVPACGIFAKLANVIPDPHKWRNNSRDVIEDCISNATAIVVNVVSIIQQDKTPEVEIIVHYGQKQPKVNINDEIVKRGFALYDNRARLDRENDLACDSGPSTARRLSSVGRFNRFTSGDEESPASSSSGSSDGADNFNIYGQQAMCQMLARSKLNNAASANATDRYNERDGSSLNNFDAPPYFAQQPQAPLAAPLVSVPRPSNSLINVNNETKMNELKAIAKIFGDKLSDPNITDVEKAIYHQNLQETMFKLAELEFIS